MATFRSLAAVAAAVSLIQHTHAWTPSLPPCLEPFQPFVYSGCYVDRNDPDTLSYRSPLDTQSMTIEKCIADCKGNGFRYAGLEYYGECYCGSTVNGPMVDSSQCTFPCTGNSSQVCGGNDLISIYQDPTFPITDPTTIADYQSIGCHTDDSPLGKTLAFPVQDVTGQPWDRETGTNDKCLKACKSQGFPFAGTEYGGECYCGVVIGNGTLSVDSSECNMPCLGNSTQNCGGPGRINIFVSKELQSLEPCGYQPPTSTSTTTTPPSSTSPTSTSTSTYPTSTTVPPTTSPTTTTTKPPTTSPTTTTTKPPTTSPPTTTSPTSTSKTSTAVCVTTTVIPPKCEYGCGHWCSDDLPDWNEPDGCKSGHSKCKMQIAACFKSAGWPGSMDCFSFSKWCIDIDNYCKTTPKNKCSKSDCFGKKPPKNGGGKPTTSTITIPCKPTTTSKAQTTTSKAPTTTSKAPTTTSKAPTTTSKPVTSTTTKCPVPTVTNICKQPTDNKLGYGPGNPVGGIELPVVTCNDLKSDYSSGNQWKLYTDSDSKKCHSFPHHGVPNACKEACKEQYDDCQAVYAQGCKKNESGDNKSGPYGWPWKRSIAGRTVWTDTWKTASEKCTAQYQDCLDENKNAAANGKCNIFGGGW